MSMIKSCCKLRRHLYDDALIAVQAISIPKKENDKFISKTRNSLHLPRPHCPNRRTTTRNQRRLLTATTIDSLNIASKPTESSLLQESVSRQKNQLQLAAPEKEFSRLEIKSRELLISLEKNDNSNESKQKMLLDLLVEWDHLLSSPIYPHHLAPVAVNIQAAVERMEDLYKARSSLLTGNWDDDDSSYHRTFEIMLRCYSTRRPYFNFCCGRKALSILIAWKERFDGNMELSPGKEHYLAVLRAYTFENPEQQLLSHASNEAGDAATDTSTTASPEEAAQVTIEIVEQLEAFGFIMAPDVETYALATLCLGQACRTLLLLQENSSMENGEQQRLAELCRQLDDWVDKLLVKYQEQQQQHNFSPSSAVANSFSHHLRQNFQQHANLVLRALGTALQCAAIAAKIQPLTMMKDTNSDHNESRLSSSFAQWQTWMENWQESLLNYKFLFAMDSDKNYNVSTSYFLSETMSLVDHSCSALQQLIWQELQDSPKECAVLLESTIDPLERFEAAAVQSLSTRFSSSSSADVDGDNEEILKDITATPRTQYYTLPMKAWNTVIDASYNDDVDAAKSLEDLMHRMEQRHVLWMERSTSRLWVDTEEMKTRTNAYNNLMQAFQSAGQTDKVLQLWKQMIANKQVHRSADSFYIILKTLAATATPGAGEQAHSIWTKMIEGHYRVPVTVEHYAATMMAWANSRHVHAAEKCQYVFDHMLVEQKKGQQLQGKRLRDNSKEAPFQKQAILRPGPVHYAALLKAWGFQCTREKDSAIADGRLGTAGAAQRVFDIYQEMLEQGIALHDSENDSCDEDISLTTMSIISAASRTHTIQGAELGNHLLNALETAALQQSSIKNSSAKARNVLLPAYATVITAWSKSDASHGVSLRKCLGILDRCQEVYRQSGHDISLRPNSAVYAACINAHTEAGAFTAAVRLLDQMESQVHCNQATLPDRKVYTAALKAQWLSGELDAVAKCQDILRRMEQAYQSGNIQAQPDAHAYTILLNAIARQPQSQQQQDSDKAEQAWQILQDMIRAFHENGDLFIRPTPYTFAAVLNAVAHSTSNEKETKQRLVQIALSVLNLLESDDYEGPNDVIYKYVFLILCRHVGDVKERCLTGRVMFQRCCQEGFMTPEIINILRAHFLDIYKKLPPKIKMNHQNLPEQWTRNVVSKGYQSRVEMEKIA